MLLVSDLIHYLHISNIKVCVQQEIQHLLRTCTDYVIKYKSVLQITNYNFISTKTTGEMCAGVVNLTFCILKTVPSIRSSRIAYMVILIFFKVYCVKSLTKTLPMLIAMQFIDKKPNNKILIVAILQDFIIMSYQQHLRIGLGDFLQIKFQKILLVKKINELHSLINNNYIYADTQHLSKPIVTMFMGNYFHSYTSNMTSVQFVRFLTIFTYRSNS